MQQLVREPRLVIWSQPQDDVLDDFAAAVRAGLSASSKSLPCRFLYDEEGSRLFEEITQVAEYYPTAAETEILATRAAEIAKVSPPGCELVELGSGSGRKTRLLIEAFLAERDHLSYRPIDISRAAVVDSAQVLLQDYPALRVEGVCATYDKGLAAMESADSSARLLLWLGSSLGNYDREAAAAELGRVCAAMSPADRLLMGIDLRKDKRTLELAYDDPSGVTARFTLNMLTRINRELDGGFELGAFRHRADYNEAQGRVELQLESLRRQSVPIGTLEMQVEFEAGELMHVENSHKYSHEELDELAKRSGFELLESWTDERGRFAEVLLAPRP